MQIEEIKAAVNAARDRRAKEIQDCPFCDSPIVQTSSTETGCTVYCLECNSDSGNFADVDDALMLWNARPAQEQADAALVEIGELRPIVLHMAAAKAAQQSGASYWRMREFYSIRAIAKAAETKPSDLCSMERGEMDPAPLVEYRAQMTEVHHGPFAVKRTPEGLELHLFCDRPPIAYAQTELNLWRQGAEKMVQIYESMFDELQHRLKRYEPVLAENWEGQYDEY